MDKLTLYTHPMSRGRTARWMLEELGQPYETVWLDYGTTMKAPAYLAINPMGKVPCLTHGDRVVTEAAAICAYLADTFPEAGLSSPDRANYFRWLFFAAGPIEAALVNTALKVEVPPERRGMVGYGSLPEALAALCSHLAARDYVAGDRFSAADVYVGSSLGWAMRFGLIADAPELAAYVARVTDRPACQRARALDDAALPA
ncbi:MAG: glutathione S-transferase family protein [Gemmobacter sp.]|uniref:glutathione S-transferase family protein n=1 Tax=Gemmobacter sp. TaxID=1898957 RepID=UPI001A580D03|nr:glutathione S-transferase family protein [Gemmobacter sp.]MBL8563544.1 glutathione S-transferase family protein [Gemmobacter sp.]